MPVEQSRQHVFRRHWVRWQPRIYAFIRTVVFRRADAEDVLQEVAAVLWDKIGEFEEGTRFDQWAFQIARYKILNFQKQKARERVKFSDALEETIADEFAAAQHETNDQIDALERCVEKLSTEHRTLLKQRYEPGATSRSVARRVGRSESAISRTLSKIYAMLSRCMQADGNMPAGDRA